MTAAQKTAWTGFIQKLLLVLVGVLTPTLIAYFIWLGTAMVEVRQKVTSIELSIASLNQSRQRATDQKSESNKQRLDALEEEGEGTE